MEEVDVKLHDLPIGKVRLDLTEIKGGGGEYDPRFVVPIKIELDAQPREHQIAIIRLSASLHLSENPNPDNQFASKVSYDLIYNIPMCSTPERAITYPKELHFSLTHAQLKALENMRHGPNKALYLNLEPVIVWKMHTGNSTAMVNGKWVSTQGEGEWSTHVGAFSYLALFWFPKIGTLRLNLAAMDWVEKIFPGMGYDNFRLIEVKLPASDNRLIPKDAIEHFREAQQDYDKGLYRECLMKCRLVHEAVEDHLKVRSGPDHKLGEAVALELGWISGTEQEKFLTGTWKPLYVLANASAHTPSTKNLLPADAHVVLILTAAMLEYLAQLE